MRSHDQVLGVSDLPRRTFAARERLIPVACGAVLTGEDGISH